MIAVALDSLRVLLANTFIGIVSITYFVFSTLITIACMNPYVSLITILAIGLGFSTYLFGQLISIALSAMGISGSLTQYLSERKIENGSEANSENLFSSISQDLLTVCYYYFGVAFCFTFGYFFMVYVGEPLKQVKLLLISWLQMKFSSTLLGDVQHCSICLNSGANIILKCGHIFHFNCIKAWIVQKESCPYCRAHISI